jgi:Ion transport protein
VTGGAGGGNGNGTGSKRPPIVDTLQEEVEEPFLVREFKARADFSLFLFSRDNPIRMLAGYILKTRAFQMIITLGIWCTVIAAISRESTSVFPAYVWTYIDVFIPAAFLFEMSLQWISLGIYGNDEAYISSSANIIDCLVNAVMILGYFVNLAQYGAFRIIRLAKMPRLLILFSKSLSIRILLRAYEESTKSIGAVTVVMIFVVLFFAIVVETLWQGGLNHCSYPGAASSIERIQSYRPTPALFVASLRLI